MNINQEKHDYLARIAWMYYSEDMIQQEIADKMGVSRFKIINLLNEAKKNGLIKVQFISPIFNCLSIEKELKQKFNLSDCVVVPTPCDPALIKQSIGIAGSNYLEKILKDGDKLGTALGTTVYETAKHFTPLKKENMEVILIIGGLTSGSERINPYDCAKMIADKLNCPCYYIFAPAFVDSKEISDAILSDHVIKKAIKRAESVNIVLIGIGEVGEDSFMIKNGYISKNTTLKAKADGAVGEVIGRFFDINGNLVPSPEYDRLISLDIESLKKIETVIALAGGKHKTEAIYGVLQAGFIDVLVTDEDTAKNLLNFQ
jgi:DNA-binding transcriptional regulator LsrR (DeoR family)